MDVCNRVYAHLGVNGLISQNNTYTVYSHPSGET